MLEALIPIKKVRKNSNDAPTDKVELKIFIPDGVKVVRGAVFNPFTLGASEQKHWQEAARFWEFAVIGANYIGVASTEQKDTLQAALEEFSIKAGRPELKHIPFCFIGMSAGAGMSRNFAIAMPERTLAVAAVCLEAAPDTPELRRIPFLTVFGEKDGGGAQGREIAARLPVQRKEGAKWGIAVQWGRGHEFGQANNLVMPFFDDVIRHRYPTDALPTGGPVKLLDYPEKQVWLGEHNGWAEKVRGGTIAPLDGFHGELAAMSWFTSKRVASTWQAFVGERAKVTLIEPAGLGDKQAFTPHRADEPIIVKVGVGSDKPGRVELFDGDVKLDTKTEAPFEFQHKLAPGIHPLFAVVHLEGKKPANSRPHTIVVTAAAAK
jgi:hypothetical protein